jgi:hypothetical protein
VFLAWSDEDQGKALAWSLQQRGRCKSCVTFDWQWPNEGVDSDLVADTYMCYGCEQIERQIDRQKDLPTQHGIKFGFFPREA